MTTYERFQVHHVPAGTEIRLAQRGRAAANSIVGVALCAAALWLHAIHISGFVTISLLALGGFWTLLSLLAIVTRVKWVITASEFYQEGTMVNRARRTWPRRYIDGVRLGHRRHRSGRRHKDVFPWKVEVLSTDGTLFPGELWFTGEDEARRMTMFLAGALGARLRQDDTLMTDGGTTTSNVIGMAS